MPLHYDAIVQMLGPVGKQFVIVTKNSVQCVVLY